MRLCRILVLAVAIMMLMTLAALADSVASGELEGSGTWTVDENGVMTFPGATSVESFDIDWDVQQQVTRVDIGANVTDFDGGAMSYYYNLKAFTVDKANKHFTAVDGVLFNKDMTELVVYPIGSEAETYAVPKGVKAIASDAFIGSNLKQLTLPEGLVSIGGQALWNCEALTKLALPASLTQLYNNSIARCMSLTAFSVAKGNPVFYADADGVLFSRSEDGSETILFNYPLGKAGSYTVPTGTDALAAMSFYSCEQMDAITIPEGVTRIGSDAFFGSQVSEVNLPASLKTIGEEAFGSCRKLSVVRYAGTKAQWKAVQIDNGNSPLQFIVIHCADGDLEPEPIEGTIGDGIAYRLTPDGLLTVSGAGEWDSWAFQENNLILKAVLKPGVTEIGWGAFNWCQALEEITIPDSVTQILYSAFYYNEALTSVTIPASVTAIGEEAFEGSGLKDIYYGGTKAQWQALVGDPYSVGTAYSRVHCSDGEIEPEEQWDDDRDYCGDGTWFFSISREDGTQDLFINGDGVVDEGFFEGWEGFSCLIIHDAWGISKSAFRNMADLKEVQIDPSVTYIGANAFAGCESIETVYYIGTSEQWAKVIIESGNDCLLNAGVQCVGGSEPEWLELVLPKGLVEIGDEAFAQTAAQVVYVPYGCRRIGAGAFRDSASIVRIDIPDTVTAIGEDAFAGCPNLVIEAPYGSYALKYAESHGLNSDGYGE